MHLPPLTRIQKSALLIGIADARNRRRVARPPDGRRMSFILSVFGVERVTTLANPQLEALRAFAMWQFAPGGDVTGFEEIDPPLLEAARRYLRRANSNVFDGVRRFASFEGIDNGNILSRDRATTLPDNHHSRKNPDDT